MLPHENIRSTNFERGCNFIGAAQQFASQLSAAGALPKRVEGKMSHRRPWSFLRQLSFVGVIVSALLTLIGAATAQDHPLERIIKTKQLKIGYIPSAPSAIKDPATGALSGFYIDAIRLVADQMKVEPIFIETGWSTFPAGLNSGEFDVCVAGTFATIDRAMAVEFTRPLQYLGYSAVVKASDTRFKTLSDMDQPGIKDHIGPGCGRT